MSLIPSYSVSKYLVNPIGFIQAGSTKCVFASKNIFENKTEADWSELEKSSNKTVTKIFYCRSPLQDKKENKLLNGLSYVCFGSEVMHHELIFEVDDEIYFRVYYGEEGLLVEKGLDQQELLKKGHPDNEVIRTKSGGDKFNKLIDILKNTPHEQKNYEVVMYNCQVFSQKIWNQF